ncbi:hypothetical protein [Chitinibacter tainanensis]|uniref:hypothetical protein n=1 Tax=Chitinibacter tainanensis TaxID=230667 RepID=UPI0012EC3E22|nr:hypothetical protein [Chitinibacter tainanensis]
MRTWTMLACGMGLASTLSVAGVFDITATIHGKSSSISLDSADDSINILETPSIRSFFAGYQGTEVVSAEINFRGVPIKMAYPTANSTKLVLEVPSINLNQSFIGATRDESEKMMGDFIKKNPQFLEAFLKTSVKLSPVDPVAGNPNSLMSRAVTQDSQAMWLGSGARSGGSGSSNTFGLGVVYGHFVSDAVGAAKSMSSDGFTLPLTYSRQFDEANHELLVNIPLGYTTVDGSTAYDASLSAVYRYPVQPNWVVAVSGGARITGSKDLAGGGWMTSLGLSSNYTWQGEGWSLSLGNMVGYYKVMRVKYDNTTISPDVANTVFRNGLLFSWDTPWSLLDTPLTIEAFVIDTRYTGTELFSNYQDEIGITFGTKRSLSAREADLRAGFSYITGEHLNGFKANFGAWF